MTAVADAGEIIEQRQIGDLVAQAVHRHQQEAEIQRHRQEYQRQDQSRLQLVELRKGEFAADIDQAGGEPEAIDGDDENGDDAGQPGARIDAALGILKDTKDYPSERIRLASQSYWAACALADYDAEAGNLDRLQGVEAELMANRDAE